MEASSSSCRLHRPAQGLKTPALPSAGGLRYIPSALVCAAHRLSLMHSPLSFPRLTLAGLVLLTAACGSDASDAPGVPNAPAGEDAAWPSPDAAPELDLQHLFDRKQYFVLHAPRQTGKTTAMRALAEAARTASASKRANPR